MEGAAIVVMVAKNLAFYAVRPWIVNANVALRLEGGLHRPSCMLLAVVDTTMMRVWILRG